MSISSVLSPMMVVPAAGSNLGTAAPVAALPTASLNEAFVPLARTSLPSPSLGALVTPRGAAALGRSSIFSGIPTLSAEDALDLQQSVNVLSGATQGASAVSALQHKTSMSILHNLGG